MTRVQQALWLFILVFTLFLTLWLRPSAHASLLGQSSPVETPTFTPSPTFTPLPTPSPTFTPVPTLPPTATFTPTQEPTSFPAPTSTPVPTAPPTPLPTPTSIPPSPPPPPQPEVPVVTWVYTPIPTYAPPLIPLPANKVRSGPTEVVTPWPTPISISRTHLPWKAYLPYIHYDWAYMYPFLQPSRWAWTSSPPAVTHPRWWERWLRFAARVLPSFFCLGGAFLLLLLEGVFILAAQRRER